MRWLRRSTSRTTGRTTGFPTSSNRASSMHLWWEPSPTVDEASVVLEVVEPPRVPQLYFWALQATFTDAGGRRYGGAHLGLQWHRPHPGGTAVNWGGYRADGGELTGSESQLPSASGNPNTRDWRWQPGTPYRLRIHRVDDGWAGDVDGTRVRTLHAGGDRLTGLVVWSEVFARCDDPPTAVRWSGFDPAIESGLRTTYQAHGDGGCANTDASPDDTGGVVQRTNTERRIGPGLVIRLGS